MLTQPAPAQMARFRPGTAPQFLVTIDTEEDFDWSAPFVRTGYRLDSVRALAEGQAYFAGRGIAPIYLADWPIIQDDRAVATLAEAAAGGSAEIGTQLHPWVTPPFSEDVTPHNSFAGNLPIELERAKLTALHDSIRQHIGVAPRIYRAGRYGLGPATKQHLAALGYRFDTSVRSGFDYRAEGGPDYRWMPVQPWWHHVHPPLLELPLTTVFAGMLRGGGAALYHRIDALWSGLSALMAHGRLLERLPLTPEGVPADRACAAIDVALELALPVLVLSFHSPSLMPGNTPYVRDAADLRDFYLWWDRVLNHLDRRGVHAARLDDVLACIQPDCVSGADL